MHTTWTCWQFSVTDPCQTQISGRIAYHIWFWNLKLYCTKYKGRIMSLNVEEWFDLPHTTIENASFKVMYCCLTCPLKLLKEWINKWMNCVFRPLLYTLRLNWIKRTSWGWWDEWDDTALQTQDSKYDPWRSEAEHTTSQSRRLLTILSLY